SGHEQVSYPELVQHYHAGEVFGGIRVQALRDAGKKSKQLRWDYARSKQGKLMDRNIEFDHEIALGFHFAVRLFADREDHAAEILHLRQNLGLRFVTVLTDEKGQASFRTDDSLGAMAKLKRVKELAVGTGHFHDFERRFTRDSVEGALA